MLAFEESFFDEEERDGFKIPRLMKRAWAAELEVLIQFGEICRVNGIRYYLGCGTLLGAVRHGGFIPWDDDIDVWMLREDVARLNDLPTEVFKAQGLELINSYRDEKNRNLAWRVDNGRTLMLQEDHLLRYHLCPFALGIDIFPLDYLPRDAEKEREQDVLLAKANTYARKWEDMSIPAEEKTGIYHKLCEVFDEKFPDEMPMQQRLMILSDRVMSMYGAEDGELIASVPEKGENGGRRFRPDWFGEPVPIAFEGIEFPAPCQAEKVLAAEYGEDYMKPQRAYLAHDYPFYKNQYIKLLNLLEANHMECPSFFE